jgi:acetolactate synthase-1/2/3 large subunit
VQVEPDLRSASRVLEGGDLVAQALAARGIEWIFSVSGGPLNSIYRATLDGGPRVCHVRHEAAAGFMADAVYRVSRRPGVALVTLGPGVTNTVTALATAQRAGVPFLLLGGQASTTVLDRGAGMEVDTLPVVSPVTKWAARVTHTDRIPEYIDEAWRRMLAGTPGPVYLELPVDVLTAPAETSVSGAETSTARPGADPSQVAAVRRILEEARRAIVLLGDDVYHSGAEADARRLIDGAGFPFGTMRLARGAVDEAHKLCFGPAYVPANPVLRRALTEADAVLLLGHEWEFDLDFGLGVHPETAVVQVHPDAAVLGRNRPSTQPVAASASAFLRALSSPRRLHADASWSEELAAEWREHRRQTSVDASREASLHPVTLVDEIAQAAAPETIFVTSHGNIDFWADARLVVRAPGRYLRAGQAGSLGAEIPYGVSAKLTRPDLPVIVFVGDGGFGYHALELDTALRYAVPVVVVVADDEKWGAIALPQERAYGVQVEMDLPRRDWAGLAQALGAYGERVDRAQDIGPALGRALASSRTAVLHVPVLSVESPYMTYISR